VKNQYITYIYIHITVQTQHILAACINYIHDIIKHKIITLEHVNSVSMHSMYRGIKERQGSITQFSP